MRVCVCVCHVYSVRHEVILILSLVVKLGREMQEANIFDNVSFYCRFMIKC